MHHSVREAFQNAEVQAFIGSLQRQPSADAQRKLTAEAKRNAGLWRRLELLTREGFLEIKM